MLQINLLYPISAIQSADNETQHSVDDNINQMSTHSINTHTVQLPPTMQWLLGL